MIERDPVVDRLRDFYGHVAEPASAPAWRPPRRAWSKGIPALAFAGVLILGAIIGISLHNARRANVVATPPVKGTVALTPTAIVHAAHFFDADHGWALTAEGLSLTHDGGASWRKVSPATTATCSAAFFLDPTYGWCASFHLESTSSGSFASVVAVDQTSDGGGAWSRHELRIPQFQAGAVYLDFVDEQHGWLSAVNTTGSNSSSARLFSTSDGGVTWEEVNVPNGQPIWFINPKTGWNVGDSRNPLEPFPGYDALFITTDGGRTWQRQAIALPSGLGKPIFSLPRFVDAEHGVLPVTFPSQVTEAFYISNDAGFHWELKATMRSDVLGGQKITLPDSPLPVAVTGRLSWVMAWGTHLQVENNGGSIAIEPRGFQQVDELAFATSKVGWGLTTMSGQCLQFKSACVSYRYLLRTVDGGQTWTPLYVP